MQKNKEYTKKKNEILDVAEKLFTTKGYEKCSVNNILHEVGIAKGTFYYYFKSKEEVLDSIIMRVTETVLERATKIAANPDLSPVAKLINVILSMRVENEIDNSFLERLHKPENALIHQKSLTEMVTRMTPLLDEIVSEGINKGVFKSDFPRQYMQIFLTSSITLLDDGIFHIKPDEQQLIIRALTSLLDKMLGVLEGTFWDEIKQYYG